METSTMQFPEGPYPEPSLAPCTCASVCPSARRHPKQEEKMGRGTVSEARWSQPSAPGRTTSFIITRAKDRNSTASSQPEAKEEGGGRRHKARPIRPRPGREHNSLGPRLLPPSRFLGHCYPTPQFPSGPPRWKALSSMSQGPVAATRMHLEDLLLQRAGPTKTPSVRFQIHYCACRGHASQGCFPPLAKCRGNSKTNPALGDMRLISQPWLMRSLRQTLLRMH